MGSLGPTELIIIGVVLVLLFGATRLPQTAKGLGQALRLFKKEIRDDDKEKSSTQAQEQATTPPPTPPSITANGSSQASHVQPAPPQQQQAPRQPAEQPVEDTQRSS